MTKRFDKKIYIYTCTIKKEIIVFRFKNKTPQKTYEHVDVGTLIVQYTALTCTGVFFYPFYHKNATWTGILRLKINTRRNSESEIHLKYN